MMSRGALHAALQRRNHNRDRSGPQLLRLDEMPRPTIVAASYSLTLPRHATNRDRLAKPPARPAFGVRKYLSHPCGTGSMLPYVIRIPQRGPLISSPGVELSVQLLSYIHADKHRNRNVESCSYGPPSTVTDLVSYDDTGHNHDHHCDSLLHDCTLMQRLVTTLQELSPPRGFVWYSLPELRWGFLCEGFDEVRALLFGDDHLESGSAKPRTGLVVGALASAAPGGSEAIVSARSSTSWRRAISRRDVACSGCVHRG